MTDKLELEEFLYRRAIDIIDSPDNDDDKEDLLFQEIWVPLAGLYEDRIVAPGAREYDRDHGAIRCLKGTDLKSVPNRCPFFSFNATDPPPRAGRCNGRPAPASIPVCQ